MVASKVKKSAKKSVKHRSAVKSHLPRIKATTQDWLVCSACGRELTVSNWGATERELYCCGRVMEKK